eukprot:COSAG02_NODE_6493_length_3538_cov_2.563536_2_plen_478_part_01
MELSKNRYNGARTILGLGSFILAAGPRGRSPSATVFETAGSHHRAHARLHGRARRGAGVHARRRSGSSAASLSLSAVRFVGWLVGVLATAMEGQMPAAEPSAAIPPLATGSDGPPGGSSMQQGGRVACGLGPLSVLSALTTLFRPLVRAPVSAYLEAMRCIDAAGVIPDVLEFAEITLDTAEDQKQFGALRGDPLPADGIAFLMTYSAEATHPPLYKDMNDKCYDSDRSKITPYGPFMVAMVRYMAQLEPYQNDTVFRGVKADLRSDYPKGRKVTWHGFASTTKSMEVLSNEAFCGTGGKRTIFAIKLTQGQAREITRYSLVPSEDEVLLPPGCRFVVESVLPQGDLSLIQLRELPSKEWIVDLNALGAAVAGEAGSGIATTQSSAAATAYQNQSQRMAQLHCNNSATLDEEPSPVMQETQMFDGDQWQQYALENPVGGIDALVSAMRSHGGDAVVQQKCAGVLYYLAATEQHRAPVV